MINFKTENEPKKKLFDFGLFQKQMRMPPREKYIFHMLFGAFHKISRKIISYTGYVISAVRKEICLSDRNVVNFLFASFNHLWCHVDDSCFLDAISRSSCSDSSWSRLLVVYIVAKTEIRKKTTRTQSNNRTNTKLLWSTIW